jgi:hypothetical protein
VLPAYCGVNTEESFDLFDRRFNISCDVYEMVQLRKSTAHAACLMWLSEE